MPKRSIRQKLLKQRQMIAASECLQRSHAVQKVLLDTDEFRQASVLALYSPIHNEVLTEEIFKAALQSGKRVCFPRVKGHSLEFVETDGPDSLQSGAFGIAEPIGEKIHPVGDIDLMVVPGVGFDRTGFRLGYGQGYYDRAVSAGRPKRLVGLAYSFQVVDSLPTEEHDICLDLLVIDSGLLAIRNI